MADFVPARQDCLWYRTLRRWAGNLGHFACLHEQSWFWGATGRVRQYGLTSLLTSFPSLSVSCLVIAVQVKEETIDSLDVEFEATEFPVPVSSIKQEVTD